MGADHMGGGGGYGYDGMALYRVLFEQNRGFREGVMVGFIRADSMSDI